MVLRRERSGSCALGMGRFLALLQASSLVTCNQTLQVVAIRAIAAEGIFIEEALDAAAKANLVGISLGSDRPAHPAMPAAAKHDGHPG